MPEMIEKDEAIKILCDGCTADCDVQYTACITVQKIIDMPTVEAEIVNHGRWIEKPPYSDETVKGLEFQIVCSRCDEQNSSITFDENSVPIAKTFYRTKFCPNCGARMDLRTPTEVDLDIVDSVMMGGAYNGKD